MVRAGPAEVRPRGRDGAGFGLADLLFRTLTIGVLLALGWMGWSVLTDDTADRVRTAREQTRVGTERQDLRRRCETNGLRLSCRHPAGGPVEGCALLRVWDSAWGNTYEFTVVFDPSGRVREVGRLEADEYEPARR
jgi:hypothetical protein